MDKKLVALMLSLLLGFVGNAARGDLNTGLVAHWQFEGNFNDFAGTNHGTAMGDAKIVTDPDRGQVLELDGTGDYVEVPNSPSLNLTGDKVSMAVWVNFNATGSTPQIIIAKVFNNTTHSSPYFSYGLHMLANAQPRTWISRTGGAANRAGATNSIQAGKWHHLAGVYNGAQLQLFLDGKLQGSTNVTGNLIGYDTVLRLGINGGLTEPMAGKMDDVRIYNRDLTEREIVALMRGVPLELAWNPNPADGAAGVNAPLLQWSAGEGGLFHDVYLGKSADLGPADRVATRQPLTLYFHAPGLEPGVTYYWRVDEIEIDMVTVHTGSAWNFTTQALTAYYPTPADGDRNVAPATTLTWQPGKNALKHRVYFSDDREAISQGTAAANKGEQNQTTFTPADLKEATTYYWRVDEVLIDGTLQTGPVWSFTTFLSVEDFESYTDDEGSRIFDAWIDGYTNGLSGSTVGNLTAPFAERTIVHSGKQSMPMDYNNVKTPFYSEAEQEFATAQDWTANGVDTLVLYVRGRAGNSPAPLYLTVKDASNRTATVVQPDTAIVGAAGWTEWKIPLSNLTNVSLTRVKKIALGVGDKANPTAGGAGRIYIDDLRVTK